MRSPAPPEPQTYEKRLTSHNFMSIPALAIHRPIITSWYSRTASPIGLPRGLHQVATAIVTAKPHGTPRLQRDLTQLPHSQLVLSSSESGSVMLRAAALPPRWSLAVASYVSRFRAVPRHHFTSKEMREISTRSSDRSQDSFSVLRASTRADRSV
jgi:hypothetical protein